MQLIKIVERALVIKDGHSLTLGSSFWRIAAYGLILAEVFVICCCYPAGFKSIGIFLLPIFVLFVGEKFIVEVDDRFRALKLAWELDEAHSNHYFELDKSERRLMSASYVWGKVISTVGLVLCALAQILVITLATWGRVVPNSPAQVIIIIGGIIVTIGSAVLFISSVSNRECPEER